MKEVRLLSSICRQFLLGLARLDRGSSRESVLPYNCIKPAALFGFPIQAPEPLSLRPSRATLLSNTALKNGASKA
jgi:hypothetical protein